MKLSIITTLYKTEPYLNEFYHRAVKSAQKFTDSFEIVLVDDGSPDSALSTAKEIQARDQRVKLVELSRNFGHHRAILAGLGQCRGEHVFLLDSDLEEAPEWLAEFYPRCLHNEVDCVIGIQKERQGPARKRLGGRLFYSLLNWLADIEIPNDVTVADESGVCPIITASH